MLKAIGSKDKDAENIGKLTSCPWEMKPDPALCPCSRADIKDMNPQLLDPGGCEKYEDYEAPVLTY